jgi:hypothetical protein
LKKKEKKRKPWPAGEIKYSRLFFSKKEEKKKRLHSSRPCSGTFSKALDPKWSVSVVLDEHSGKD